MPYYKIFETLALAQEIVDYCVAAGAAEEGDVAAAAAAWGFEVAAGGTMKDFADALEEAYGADVAGMIGTEAAGSTVDDLFPNLSEYSGVAIKLGDSADNITGIQKTGANTLRIVTTKVDATAIYKLGIPITPMHYYGSTAKYDYANIHSSRTRCSSSSRTGRRDRSPPHNQYPM